MGDEFYVASYEADRRGRKELEQTNTASPREDKYGENAPTDSELKDDDAKS